MYVFVDIHLRVTGIFALLFSNTLILIEIRYSVRHSWFLITRGFRHALPGFFCIGIFLQNIILFTDNIIRQAWCIDGWYTSTTFALSLTSSPLLIIGNVFVIEIKLFCDPAFICGIWLLPCFTSFTSNKVYWALILAFSLGQTGFLILVKILLLLRYLTFICS